MTTNKMYFIDKNGHRELVTKNINSINQYLLNQLKAKTFYKSNTNIKRITREQLYWCERIVVYFMEDTKYEFLLNIQSERNEGHYE